MKQHGGFSCPPRIKILALAILAVCMISLLDAAALPCAFAQESREKTVRVGWYESTYCYRDQFGRRRGIAYEYQQKIAAHTGWIYEYVEDSWPNLLQMLMDGKIDLLSDVSYKEERAEFMLYSSLPMGEESYYLYIDADNTVINPEDLQTLSGKRVGVNKGSYQEGLLRDWAEKNGVEIEIVELADSEAYSMNMLAKGEIDALVSMDSFGAQERVLPVCKIGASEYYFTVSKDRPDLLNELNTAMTAIQDEDPYNNQRLFDEYIHLIRTNAFLTPALESWLKAHGTIRVGYRNDYLPFCALDNTSGELTGALRDYLAYASKCLKNAEIHFEAIPYPTTNAAMEAMKNGEIDCVFPVNLSSYDGEMMGLLTVNPIMQTEINILVRAADKPKISSTSALRVVMDEENMNYDTFVKDHFPNWTITAMTGDARRYFEAVALKEADCLLISDYRMNELNVWIMRNKLVSLPSGESMQLSFAVRRSDHALYSILNKIANLAPSKDMEYALATHAYTSAKVSIAQFLQEHWIVVLIFISAVFLTILFLMRQKLIVERKANEQQKQIEDALRRELTQREQLQTVMKMAYTDPLTGVKSKQAFAEAERKMDQRIAEKAVSEFAVAVFDLNDLKKINDTQGHEAGDRFIRDACRCICLRFKHSPVYRIGGDEFVAVLEGDDYANREELFRVFCDQMEKNTKDGAMTIASGYAVFDPEKDSAYRAVFERADKEMYQRKVHLKALQETREDA